MSLDYSIIGTRIKKARLDKGITQEELAEKIDVSVAFLSRIEHGNSYINLKRLNQVCEILGIPEGSILNGTADNSPTYLNKEFSDLLKNCPPDKLKKIYNIAKIIIED